MLLRRKTATRKKTLAEVLDNAETSPSRVRCKEATEVKTRGVYRRYTSQEIEELFGLVIEEGRTAKEAALITGMNVRTAQHYAKTWNNMKKDV